MDADQLKNELDHLGILFKKNGYHNKQINEAINKYNHRKKYFKVPMITFPYIKGTTNSITNILKKISMIVAFDPANSIRIFVDYVKESLEKR